MENLNTISLADRVKSLIGKDSHYALAKALGVTREGARCWYTRQTVMDDEVGIRAAKLLNIDPESVILWLQVERAEKKGNATLSQHWRHIAEQIAA